MMAGLEFTQGGQLLLPEGQGGSVDCVSQKPEQGGASPTSTLPLKS